MTLPLRRRALSLAALATFCRPAAAESFTLEELMARLAAQPERRATFREEKRIGALDGALVSTGTLRLHAGTVEKNTLWPVPERLEIGADRIVVTAGNDPPRVIDAGMAPELRTLIDAVRGPLVGDVTALRRAFEATLSGDAAGWSLLLVPRDPAGRKLLRQVRLEGHDATVTRLSVASANGDEQVMTIIPAG